MVNFSPSKHNRSSFQSYRALLIWNHFWWGRFLKLTMHSIKKVKSVAYIEIFVSRDNQIFKYCTSSWNYSADWFCIGILFWSSRAAAQVFQFWSRGVKSSRAARIIFTKFTNFTFDHQTFFTFWCSLENNVKTADAKEKVGQFQNLIHQDLEPNQRPFWSHFRDFWATFFTFFSKQASILIEKLQ